MAFKRWDTIAQSVLENLEDLGQRKVNKERVLAELQQVEGDIARDGLAIPGSTTIVTVIGQTDYPLVAPVWRIERIFRNAAWTLPIDIVLDKNRWELLLMDTTISGSEQPLAVTVRAGNVIFYPAPSDVQTLTLWTYNVSTDPPAEGADPEVDAAWDDALILGGTSRLIRDLGQKAAWKSMYDQEVRKQSTRQMKTPILAPQIVDHSSSRLGF